VKAESDGTLLGQTRAAMQTPSQRYMAELANIQSELGDAFAESLGLDGAFANEKKFAQLEARKRYLESLPDEGEPVISVRRLLSVDRPRRLARRLALSGAR
jgi:hypothetical protein